MEHEAYIEMAAAEHNHWWFSGRRQVLNSVIRRLSLKPGAKILELGSGTGGNLAMLAQYGQVTAVEMNDAAREIALNRGDVPDIRAGHLPHNLPLADQKFDLICLFDVLEHVEEDRETLSVIAGHLAPGAAAIITVPAYRRLWGPHDVALHHKRRYERRELLEKLHTAGFTVEKLSFMNMALLPAAILMRLKDKWTSSPAASGTETPPPLLNKLFTRIFGAEAHLPSWVNLPFGLSLIAVVRKMPPHRVGGGGVSDYS